MNQMQKAERVLKFMQEVHHARTCRLEEHLGVEDKACRNCEYFKDYEGEWVNYCSEAKRLAGRIRSCESRARAVTLLVLENVHARG